MNADERRLNPNSLSICVDLRASAVDDRARALARTRHRRFTMTFDLQYRSPAPGITVARPGTMKRFIVENNPFYLLSAACMLLGLMTLTNSLSFSPIPHHRL